MKNLHIILAIIILTLLNSTSPAKDNKMHKCQTFKEKGLVLKVDYDSVIVIGNPIKVRICLRNISDTAIILGHIKNSKSFSLVVRDSNAKKISLTRLGNTEIGDNEGQIKKFSYTKINPDDSICVEYDISKIFDITAIGIYELQISNKNIFEDIKLQKYKKEDISTVIFRVVAEK